MTASAIASVCRTLPTPIAGTDGIFVFRRIQAVAGYAQVHVCQPLPYFPVIRPLAAWAKNENHQVGDVTITHAPMFYLPGLLKRLDAMWLYRAVRRQLREWHRTKKLDAIDAHFGYPDGVGAVRVAREIGVPVFVTVRGVEEEYLRTPAIAKIMLDALQQADGCICVSHSLKEVLVKAGVSDQKIRVIHNAVDRQTFAPQSKNEARETLGISEESRLIVSVGNLLSVKGHDVLVRSFAEVRSNHVSAKLVVIGAEMHEPSYHNYLKRLSASLGVSEHVKFVGRQKPEDVSLWLAAADAFALASRREGCCNALLESLACGVPSVVTSVGDNPSFVHDGQNGYLVRTDCPEEMAQRLHWVLESDHWRKLEISNQLGVSDWSSVGMQVLDFMNERIEAARRATR